MHKTYTINGMTCEHCVKAITEEVSALDGVDNVTVSLESGSMTIDSAEEIPFGKVADAVDEAGEYTVAEASSLDTAGHPGGQCGCGGHGHAGKKAEGSGCGCGGHDAPAERPHEMAAEPIASTAGGCGCGDGAPSAGNVHAGGAGVIHRPGADELVIHSIPRVVRHAVLFAAVDNLPVGENIQICAPHQPEPLFAHLQDSEQHYRVETLEVGPVDWRYRITRLA